MRHSEILSARFEHVDFANLRLFVPHAKSGMREQPITKQLADMLAKEREMRDNPEWIFPAARPRLSAEGRRTRMDRPFQRAVLRAGLDPKQVTPHVMRHTAITRLVQAGVDLPTIQQISGHKTLSMVLRYTHIHGEHINKAISVLGYGIPELCQNKTPGTITPKLHIVSEKTA